MRTARAPGAAAAVLLLALGALAGACGGPAFTMESESDAAGSGGDAAPGEPPVLDAGPGSLRDSSAGDGDDGRTCMPRIGCMGSSAGAVCEAPWSPCPSPTDYAPCGVNEACCVACL